MGKKQHQKDKLYLTCTEWRTLYGGKKEGIDKGEFRRLPFFCCSLSMQPFEHPYCTNDGVIFDLMNIVPFLKKFGINPVDGEKLSAKELTKLTFHKNSNGKFHCPVTFRIFNENTHIVAIKPTGNVFCYEAVEQLNLKPGFFRDLITDEPFTKKDIIGIQDPTNLDKFNLQKFFHLKKSLKVLDEEEEEAKKHPRYKLKSVNAETRSILDELDTTYTAPEKLANDKKKADRVNAAHYSTGKVAASFTSTSMDLETEHEAAIIDEDLLRYERIKKKGYARITTNLGPLNLELHADMIPKACENFIRHSLAGYYNGTIFHRSIRNFMIQGGDPDGTGLGGDSVWGGPFKDHFKPNLTHTGRGILSMANTGPDSNKSQFFITYRSARHLDSKHTIFGRVVGGLETLDKMEAIETDTKERPKKEIRIETCQVFVNPYDDVDDQLKKEREDAVAKETNDKEKAKQKPAQKKDTEPKVFKAGVGKYINPATQKRTLADEANESAEAKKKKKEVKGTFGDFSAWKRTLADEANESAEAKKKKKEVKGTFGDFSAW